MYKYSLTQMFYDIDKDTITDGNGVKFYYDNYNDLMADATKFLLHKSMDNNMRIPICVLFDDSIIITALVKIKDNSIIEKVVSAWERKYNKFVNLVVIE